ncbi:similar to Saccharomyces cerevisiae YJR021C REC107 Protein involved in early stages of meiotic recombination [Maudiozyma saulgeensis]|uniref:Similar to Saccharomyces cerevisiae YJR021C REC107 Protein involved in early stages of meiotic recombination n=1 Tax=Maudiozyma saulgeensis TaxID=1789683 RepID=A0A1X7R532_9SACH|nr:similar to Saccharomyces cerevisiae YJR021C REC107 Protein involved in early stages of meiotic recombination [Kazachstania saulgeensis]
MDTQQIVDRDDEIPTDVSSSSRDASIGYATSTPTKQIRNEADKQILEWASKLELESIELRERSTTLLQNLNEKYINFNSVVNKFDQVEKKEITNRTYNMTQELWEKQTDRTYEMQVMKTLTEQMEDVQILLTNISRDMNKLQDRQAQLEKRFVKQEKALAAKQEKKRSITSALLNGTTLSNDVPRNNVGPLTRSQSKFLKEIGFKPTTRVHKPHSLASRTTARTIIPWDELTMPSDNPPPEAECTTNYPSEL